MNKPGKPKRARSDNQDLIISWDASSCNLPAIDYFEIQWKKKNEKRWSGIKCTDDNSTSIVIPITDFEQNLAYQFKVKCTTKNGDESSFSEVSDDVLISRSPQQPGKISSLHTTATSVCLLWEKPKQIDKVSSYEVIYRACGDVEWLTVSTKQRTESLDLKDLKSRSTYQFKVRAIFSDNNKGPFSEVSDPVITHESLATRLKKISTKVGLANPNPQRYKIPLTFCKETTNKTAMTRKLKFGERDQLRPTKTIMVVGATGAGKSTMIDGMINYIVDVAWEDDFRFTMIDLTEDEKKNVHKQASSQTAWITSYEVNYQPGSRLDYNLNIIDTPGFGGTLGIEQDKKIVDQIREFFKAPGDQGVDSIDAICFITQAPQARLTPTQKYIFDSILSVFGKDVKDNIFALITFSDSKKPPVLTALKEANFPFQQDFTFNNAALFDCNDSTREFSKMFWKLGKAGFDTFFENLKRVQKRSLQLTSEVLALRKQIENTIDRLQLQVRNGLQELNRMKKETDILDKHQRDIEANKNFTYLAEEVHQRKVDTKPGQYTTNCSKCNFTCHKNCAFKDDNEKKRCCAMKDGFCTVCAGQCHWGKHKNNNFYYETYDIKVERTYEHLKEKYQSAVARVEDLSAVLNEIKSAFKSQGQIVVAMIRNIRDCINKLEDYALKPHPLNEATYIKLLIESEKREATIGWETRVQILEELKAKAGLLEKIPDASVQDYWTDEDIAKFLKSV